MAVSKEDIMETIGNMTVLEVVELVEAMEEKFGVSAAVATVAASPGGDGDAAEATEEQTEFTVVLTSFGAKKVPVIKVVRGLTNLGLKEAKELVEGAPANIKEDVSKDEADEVKKLLEEAGATVEVK